MHACNNSCVLGIYGVKCRDWFGRRGNHKLVGPTSTMLAKCTIYSVLTAGHRAMCFCSVLQNKGEIYKKKKIRGTHSLDGPYGAAVCGWPHVLALNTIIVKSFFNHTYSSKIGQTYYLKKYSPRHNNAYELASMGSTEYEFLNWVPPL